MTYADCRNPDIEHVVSSERHYGLAAMEKYREDHPEPESGTLISVGLPESEEQQEAREQAEKDQARREIEEMKARHGQP